MLQNFRTHQLAVQFYQTTRTKKLPTGLQQQLGRAASSIALNLAEGYGRRAPRDRVRFYQIALGSIRECQSILMLEQQAFTTAEQKMLDKLGAGTYLLIRNHPNLSP